MEKSLICITTCNRLHEVRKYLLPYIEFVRNNRAYDFILSLDGNGPDYIEFCDSYGIPLLYSDDREGVGISKNRVLRMFPEYVHYFFIEDDIELVNNRIFNGVIKIANQTGFPHYTIAPLRNVTNVYNVLNDSIVLAMKGGATFSYFSRSGLDKVGGWHTEFSKYKRFGHTEHSMRFVNRGLQPTPFICVAKYILDIIIHDPPHVTNVRATHNMDEISSYEEEIIRKKLDYFPITTLSDLHYNGMSLSNPGNELITKALKSSDRYFLVNDSREKRKAKADFKVYLFKQEESLWIKLKLMAEILLLYPTSNSLKHLIKQKIKNKS